jgi:hypothetical protein
MRRLLVACITAPSSRTRPVTLASDLPLYTIIHSVRPSTGVRPLTKSQQADELVDKAVEDLYPIFHSTVADAPVPPNASPEAYREAVSALAAARAALLIELTHFGKEVAQGNSPYKQMWDDYRQQLLQVATMLGLVVPGLTPTNSTGVAIVEGSHISLWGNDVIEPYADMMTRPM